MRMLKVEMLEVSSMAIKHDRPSANSPSSSISYGVPRRTKNARTTKTMFNG